MKKTSLILMALAAGFPLLAGAPGLTVASGDSSLTVFGILDAGIANVQHTLSFSDQFVTGTNPTALVKSSQTTAGSATGVMNGGVSQTRWGIKGQLGLAPGLKGVFDLESAFSLGNGMVGSSASAMQGSNSQVSADTSLQSQFFGRAAYVGIASDSCGTLTIGRHTSLLLDLIPGFDALGGAQMFTPIGFSGSYGGGGATDNSRVDNSLKYKVNVGEFTVNGLYKLSGVAGNATARGVSEFAATWEHAGFGIMVGYQFAKDTTSIGNPANKVIAASTNATTGVVTAGTYSPMGTVTLTAENTHATMLAAHYKIGDWYFAAGYEKEALTNPSDPAVMASLTSVLGMPIAGTISATGAITPAVNVTPFTVEGVPMEKDLTVLWFGANYNFTKKLNLALSYYHVAQNDFSNGNAIAADKSGTTTYTSALLDYQLNKAFDSYIGYMKTSASDSMAAGIEYPSNAVLGAGVRYKF